MKSNATHTTGQALILILLAMGVVLTVSLSVVSRSISDIAVTTKEEESLRAFSAAEAGVEEALTTNLTTGTTTGNPEETSSFTTTISGFPVSTTEYVYPLDLVSGDSATIWLMSHDDTDNLVCPDCFFGPTIRLCWGEAGVGGFEPAVEVSVLYEDSGSVAQIARAVYDNQVGRTPGSTPPGTSCTIAGQNFTFGVDLDFGALGILPSVYDTAGGLKLLRVRMLYNTDRTQILGVNTLGGLLPSQGRLIDSVGSTAESTRRVNVFELYPDLPSIFDAAILSPSGVTK